MKTFLHGLLVVEDKMSMAHGLESRVPFLDNDLVDFACKLPPHYKVAYADDANAFVDENDLLSKYRPPPGAGVGKIVLRAAMEKVISPTVTNRVKKGFSAPDASWFRGESIEYVNELLRDPQAAIYDYLRPAYVHRKLEEHATGKHNHRLFIWSLLSFEWWLREFLR
jgi:asparagine synthase (glutamine-hydrolysing)